MLAIVGGAAVTMPVLALAHTALRTSEPNTGVTVAAPSRLVLRFGDPVDARGAWVLLTGPQDTKIGLARPTLQESATLIYSLLPLKRGPWEVWWSVESPDGHRVEGVLSFTVVGL